MHKRERERERHTQIISTIYIYIYKREREREIHTQIMSTIYIYIYIYTHTPTVHIMEGLVLGGIPALENQMLTRGWGKTSNLARGNEMRC